ncbi:hypothetical protein [Lysinibacillus fusiformis]|uniref:hypothetical protein n=1 Tax=Lysinibacillus fusiformis TaxID=28031 RepID=UPI00148DFA48|nr:hypothetical protein [Lysinibacillus fusiformis]NOG28516.1 hypothetical protein [Lysinibacillus fusiformis]
MAEIFKFFNSAPGDERWHYASDFADYFGNVLSSGLLHKNGTPNLQVKVNAGTMQTYVEAGEALIQGYQYQNTTPLFLTHGLPEPNLDRIDRIVLRLDKRNNARFIRLFVKEGVSATNPVPPVLQRDQYVFELSLAQIRLTKNTSSLEPLKLIDERMKEDLCGIVYSLISVPTSVFQQQWDYWFNLKKQTLEDDMEAWQLQQKNDFETWQAIQKQEYLTWIESIKDILDENVAANLAARIASLEQQMVQTNSRIDTHIADYVKHPFHTTPTFASNVYNVTISTPMSDYIDGMGLVIKCPTASTSNVAIKVNSLPQKAVLNSNGSLVKNFKKDTIYTVRYNATVTNPTVFTGTGAFILQGEGGEYGNATEIDVAKGKTFGTDNGLKTGTAIISKMPPFMPNAHKYYTSGELRSWNHLSAPVFATKGLFGITATNTPDNVYATKVYRLNVNGTVAILWDSNTQTWISATTFRSVWHHDMSYTFYQSDFNLGLNIWFVQTSSQLLGSVTTAKPLAGSISGIMQDGFMYTIERQSGITYLHKMNPPYAVNQGGIVQSFSVPLDAYNTNINLSYVWRVQLIDGYVLFIRTDYKEVRLYDLKLTLVKTITVDYGTGQEALLMSYDTVRNLLSSTIVYDRDTGAFGFKNTGLQPYYANVHSYPYNWITSNG